MSPADGAVFLRSRVGTLQTDSRKVSVSDDVEGHVHEWRLVDEEYEDAGTIRVFVCVLCETVRCSLSKAIEI